MSASDNYEQLKAAEGLALATNMAVQDGGYKRKATLSQVADVIAATINGKKDLGLTTVWADGANGTGTVEFTFTLGGAALAEPISGFFYSSGAATGLAASALTTGATASKGVISPILSGTTSHYHFITNATGELDMTLTAAAGSWWIVFKQNDSTLLISDELAITGP